MISKVYSDKFKVQHRVKIKAKNLSVALRKNLLRRKKARNK